MNTTNPTTFEQYQSERQAVFPSMNSLLWFVRSHREALINSGAVISPTGRKVIVPAVFDRVVQDVGQQRALRDATKNFRTAKEAHTA